ncbi:MAG: hypothetical protein LBL98_08620 [Ruminococcus sp.]|jgi:hypothetical protein|nr:hypothetical protein [Ruminococcus sp.]
MSDEKINEIITLRNNEMKSNSITPYEIVKEFLDKRANETARDGAIAFSKLFKPQGV